MSLFGRTLSLFLALMLRGICAVPSDYPPVTTPGPGPSAIQPISRTLALLRKSTAAQPSTVRVAFHGQSITLQHWVTTLRAWLIQQYPTVQFEFRNFAVSGFTSDFLFRTVDGDVAAYHPDLLILHCYGDLSCYARLVRRIRERTTSDILLQNDHLLTDAEYGENRDPAQILPSDVYAWKSYVMLPVLGRRTDATLADVRDVWHHYLRQYSLRPRDLLLDDTHLNFHGDEVLTQGLARYFKAPPGTMLPDPDNTAGVRTLVVGRDIDWEDGVLAAEVFGSRIEVITSGSSELPISVELDGRPPSAHAGNFQHLRPHSSGLGLYPLVRVAARTVPAPELWKAEILETTRDGGRFRFAVSGSFTGPDGIGTNTTDFVSRSGRVVIESRDWQYMRISEIHRLEITNGSRVTWSTISHAVDEFAARNRPVVVSQGIPDAPHRLILRAAPGAQRRITGVRSYSPSRRMSGRNVADSAGPDLRVEARMDSIKISWLESFPDVTLTGYRSLSGGPFVPLPNQRSNLEGQRRTLNASKEDTGFFTLRSLPTSE